MRYVSLMKVVNSKNYLLPEELGFDFGHLTVWFTLEVAMQRASIDVFHDKEDLLVTLKSLEELCKALMINLFHNLDLSFHTLSAIRL